MPLELSPGQVLAPNRPSKSVALATRSGAASCAGISMWFEPDRKGSVALGRGVLLAGHEAWRRGRAPVQFSGGKESVL